MSSIYRRAENGVWYLQWYEGKRLRKVSLRTKDRKIAEREKGKFDGERELVDHGLVDPRVPPDDLFRRWMDTKPGIKERTRERYHEIWRRVSAFLGSMSVRLLGEVSPAHLVAYVSARMAMGPASKTIAEELLMFKGMLKWAMENGFIRKMPQPWPRIKTTVSVPEKVGAYTAEEVARILEAFRGTRFWEVMCFLAWTGVRRSEALAVRVADIDLAGEVVRIESEKTARNSLDQFREVEIHPELAPILRELIRGKPHDALVFPDFPREDLLTERIRSVCRRLKIRYRRLHGLRHSWISRMLAAGCPLAVVIYQAGHRNIGTTMRYLTVKSQAGWVRRI